MLNQKPTFRQAVFIVTYRIIPKINKVEYLILKRKKHWKGWEFPKGGIDKGEDMFNTARREAREESGIKPIKIRRFSVSGKYLYPHKLRDRPGKIGQTYTLFSAEVPFGKKTKIDASEHSNYLWTSYEHAVKLVRYQNQKRCLGIVNKSLMG
mgnify:CR=1 FL=1